MKWLILVVLLCFNSITKASYPPPKGADLPILNIDPNYSDSIQAILKRERVLSLKKVSNQNIVYEEFDSLGRLIYQEFRAKAARKERGYHSYSYIYYDNGLVASRRMKSHWDDILDTFNYDKKGRVIYYNQVLKVPTKKYRKTPLADYKEYETVFESYKLEFFRYSGQNVIMVDYFEIDNGSRDSSFYTINPNNRVIHYKSKFLIDSTSIIESNDTIFESRWVKTKAYNLRTEEYETTDFQLLNESLMVTTHCNNLKRIKEYSGNKVLVQDVLYDGKRNEVYHSFGSSSHIYYEYGNSGLISRLNIQSGDAVEVYKYFYHTNVVDNRLND